MLNSVEDRTEESNRRKRVEHWIFLLWFGHFEREI